MSVLLIGGDSHIGQSLTNYYSKTETKLISFSSRKLFSEFSYNEFQIRHLDSINTVILIGTPGHFNTNHGLSKNLDILKILNDSKVKVFGISTIRTLDYKNKLTDEYLKLNSNFEKILTQYSNFRIIRIPNFLGNVPNVKENQSFLLPWSLLNSYQTQGYLRIESSLESEFEWVTPEDINLCITIFEEHSEKFGIFELQYGFRNRLRDLVDIFSDFQLESGGKKLEVRIAKERGPRKITEGKNQMSSLGWKSSLSDKIFREKFLDYLQKNWRCHG